MTERIVPPSPGRGKGREGYPPCLNWRLRSGELVRTTCGRDFCPCRLPGGSGVSHGLAQRRFLYEGFVRRLPSRVGCVSTILHPAGPDRAGTLAAVFRRAVALVRRADPTAEVRAVAHWRRDGIGPHLHVMVFTDRPDLYPLADPRTGEPTHAREGRPADPFARFVTNAFPCPRVAVAGWRDGGESAAWLRYVLRCRDGDDAKAVRPPARRRWLFGFGVKPKRVAYGPGRVRAAHSRAAGSDAEGTPDERTADRSGGGPGGGAGIAGGRPGAGGRVPGGRGSRGDRLPVGAGRPGVRPGGGRGPVAADRPAADPTAGPAVPDALGVGPGEAVGAGASAVPGVRGTGGGGEVRVCGGAVLRGAVLAMRSVAPVRVGELATAAPARLPGVPGAAVLRGFPAVRPLPAVRPPGTGRPADADG